MLFAWVPSNVRAHGNDFDDNAVKAYIWYNFNKVCNNIALSMHG